MPAENLEDQSLAKNPRLELAQWLFSLTIKDDPKVYNDLMNAIKEKDMAPFYKQVNFKLY